MTNWNFYLGVNGVGKLLGPEWKGTTPSNWAVINLMYVVGRGILQKELKGFILPAKKNWCIFV